ncbi:MAG: molybdenum cofactor biosynthesis protein B [Mycobacteriales bacterium]
MRVITVSDRVSAGSREDISGTLLAQLLGADAPVVVPDEREAIASAVKAAVTEGVDLLVTTGGTGIAPRDVTPEAVRPLLDRELPGVMEAIRAEGRAVVPTAALSRGVAGVIGSTFVVTLPGSAGGARDGARVVQELAQHVVDQLAGHDH